MKVKTLSLPVIGSMIAATTLPALCQVQMLVESDRTYRQTGTKDISFRNGNFGLIFTDGSWSYQGGCDFPVFQGPTLPCPIGTTGFLIEGNPDPLNPTLTGPYYPITSLQQAIGVEPRRPDLCFLRAAPASSLPRPSGLFNDFSYSFYYNIRTPNIAEYTLTDYRYDRAYTNKQLSKMDSDVVPGVYQFTFPRLGRPDTAVPISSVIYPMPNGYEIKRSRPQGFRFTNLKKFEDGFQILDPNLVNTIRWEGLGIGNVYPSADQLYFSIRNLEEPDNTTHQGGNAKSNAAATALFPAFVGGGDDKVLLANPFVRQFVLPPGLHEVFRSGHKGLVEVKLERSITTNGVSYDRSSRSFQMPVKFVDRYKNFAAINFRTAKKKIGLTDDFDGDGFKNFEEWALRSNPTRPDSRPIQPVAGRVTDIDYLDGLENIFDFVITINTFYGFRYNKRHDLVPGVNFIFEQSNTNVGPWTPLLDDDIWNVAETPDDILVSYNSIFFEEVPAVPRFFRVRVVLAP